MEKCQFCNSSYHRAKGDNPQLVLLNCIAANLADLVVTMEEK